MFAVKVVIATSFGKLSTILASVFRSASHKNTHAPIASTFCTKPKINAFWWWKREVKSYVRQNVPIQRLIVCTIGRAPHHEETSERIAVFKLLDKIDPAKKVIHPRMASDDISIINVNRCSIRHLEQKILSNFVFKRIVWYGFLSSIPKKSVGPSLQVHTNRYYSRKINTDDIEELKLWISLPKIRQEWKHGTVPNYGRRVVECCTNEQYNI